MKELKEKETSLEQKLYDRLSYIRKYNTADEIPADDLNNLMFVQDLISYLEQDKNKIVCVNDRICEYHINIKSTYLKVRYSGLSIEIHYNNTLGSMVGMFQHEFMLMMNLFQSADKRYKRNKLISKLKFWQKEK
jgi:hypothetical protein